jgi:hypothetical protein
MNELEKYERDIAKDMAILYCVEKDENSIFYNIS